LRCPSWSFARLAAYAPSNEANDAGVACALVQRRDFGTRAEADACARDLWFSAAPWRRQRTSPEDVIEVIEAGTDDEAAVGRWLHRLSEEPQIREQALHIYRYWIAGKNPYYVCLSEARAYRGSDAVAMLEGDHGGQTYVVCPVALIRCDESTLQRLLLDIDALEWGDPSGARLSYFRAAVGENVGGGMGGGLVTPDIWVPATLRDRGLEPQIVAVLAGDRPTIG
jgi:hypothetical protein